MAEETLDVAVKAHDLSATPCKTVGLMLEGAKGWTPTLFIRLVQDYGLENEVRALPPIRLKQTAPSVATLWSLQAYFSTYPGRLRIRTERSSTAGNHVAHGVSHTLNTQERVSDK